MRPPRRTNNMELIPLPKRTPAHCPAYCDCEFPHNIAVTAHKGPIADMAKCRCGAEELPLQWTWHRSDDETTAAATSDCEILGPDVTFHPTYSQGTAIVRGARPLAADMVHFWEMRVITALAGTDVMFGIGTDKVDLDQFKFHFVSALGTNAQSWGFSYNGRLQHNGVQLPYGQKFSQGCIVGVLLDRPRGRLEFYLNRRRLGVAYTNIPADAHIKLYPMVCSTAAKSVVRLINASSHEDCLQLRSFQTLAQLPSELAQLHQMPGLRTIWRSYWFLAPPVRYSQRSAASELDMLDEAVLSSQAPKRLGRKQKFKDDDADINDLYTNAHKIAMHHEDHDEDFSMLDYFDEYFNYLY